MIENIDNVMCTGTEGLPDNFAPVGFAVPKTLEQVRGEYRRLYDSRESGATNEDRRNYVRELNAIGQYGLASGYSAMASLDVHHDRSGEYRVPVTPVDSNEEYWCVRDSKKWAIPRPWYESVCKVVMADFRANPDKVLTDFDREEMVAIGWAALETRDKNHCSFLARDPKAVEKVRIPTWMVSQFENGYIPCDSPPGNEEMYYKLWQDRGGKVNAVTVEIEAAGVKKVAEGLRDKIKLDSVLPRETKALVIQLGELLESCMSTLCAIQKDPKGNLKVAYDISIAHLEARRRILTAKGGQLGFSMPPIDQHSPKPKGFTDDVGGKESGDRSAGEQTGGDAERPVSVG